jgi:6-phosphogluconolactonase
MNSINRLSIALTLVIGFIALAAPLRAEFAYVTNVGSDNVSAFRIDPTTGALTPVAGSPFPTGSEPRSVGVDLLGRFLYVGNYGDRNISAYRIGENGGLTPIPASPFYFPGNSMNSIAVDFLGRFVYLADAGNGGNDNLVAFSISRTTGSLTAVSGSPFPTGIQPFYVAVDLLGRFVYVTDESGVSAFSVNRGTGALTPILGSPFFTPGLNAGDEISSMAMDPLIRFVYVANNGGVSVYRINPATGALTPVHGSPFTVGGFPYSMAIDPWGQFIYAINNDDSNVSVYRIDPASGAVTAVPGSPFPTGTYPLSVAVDLTGRFVYVANGGSGNVSAYRLDRSTGALTAVPESPFPSGIPGVGCAGVAVAP